MPRVNHGRVGMRGSRAGFLAIAFALLAGGTAHASQVGIEAAGSDDTTAHFVSAPWAGSSVELEITATEVIFRDFLGTISIDPPLGMQPCRVLTKHEAHCPRAPRVEVNLGQAGNTYRDVPTAAAEGVNVKVIGGVGNDDIESRLSWPFIQDNGGSNRVVLHSGGSIDLVDPVATFVDVDNLRTNYVTCWAALGVWTGPNPGGHMELDVLDREVASGCYNPLEPGSSPA
jgi:hypothetical protein